MVDNLSEVIHSEWNNGYDFSLSALIQMLRLLWSCNWTYTLHVHLLKQVAII